MLENMPRDTRSTPTPLADAAPTETGVSRDLAKTQNLIGRRRALWTRIPVDYHAGGYLGQSRPWGG